MCVCIFVFRLMFASVSVYCIEEYTPNSLGALNVRSAGTKKIWPIATPWVVVFLVVKPVGWCTGIFLLFLAFANCLATLCSPISSNTATTIWSWWMTTMVITSWTTFIRRRRGRSLKQSSRCKVRKTRRESQACATDVSVFMLQRTGRRWARGLRTTSTPLSPSSYTYWIGQYGYERNQTTCL